MTKPKGTRDLQEQIAAKVTTPTTPTDGDGAGSGDELRMAAYRRAILDDDPAEIRRLAAELLISQSAVELHQTLLSEHAELAEASIDQDRLTEDARRLERTLGHLRRVRPSSVDDAARLEEQIREVEADWAKANYAASLAGVAASKADSLRRWAGPLFGDHRNPVGLPHGSATLQECERLGIDFRSPDAWRGRPADREGRRAVRIVNTTIRK